VHNDSLFRAVFARPENLRGWLRELLRDQPIAGQIDWDSLALLAEVTIDLTLQRRDGDLAAILRCFGSEVRLLVPAEHFSGRQRTVGTRMVVYSARMLQRWDDEHPHGPTAKALPIVLHSGKRPLPRLGSFAPEAATRRGGVRTHGLELHLVVDDLAHQTEASIRARDLPVAAKLAFLHMQFIDGASPDQVEALLLSWKALFQQLARPPGAIDDVGLFQAYVLRTTEMPFERCRKVFAQILDEEGTTIMQSTADKLMAIARAEGEAIGEARGEARGEAIGECEGRRQMMRELLLRRFGSIPKRRRTQLSKATKEVLDAWALRLLDAKTIDEVFAV